MKLILAVMHDDDSAKAIDALNRAGYGVTRLCSTGGFLRSGNTTLLMGIEDEKLEGALAIIKANSTSRKRYVQPVSSSIVEGMHSGLPVEVTVGGATIFVIAMEKMEKI